ncbi:MAG: outer membrane beta-barrel protein [Acidobacteriota bacterium]|nr:outer membrane beta-barrel protein [Acidobacteriota bacterium]
MRNRPITARWIAGIFLAAAVAVIPVMGQDLLNSEETTPRKKYGFYIGVHMTQFSVGEDFDGVSVVVPANVEGFIMPSFQSTRALGFSLGAGTGRGGRDRFSVELRYSQAKPDAVFAEGTASEMHPATKASNWSVSARYMYTEWFLQPYFRAGLSYSRLRVADGAIAEDGTTGDAVFIGGGVEIALGLAIWLQPCFSIFAEGSYDSMDYRNVKGMTGDAWSTVGQDGSGLVAGGLRYAIGIQFMY